MSAAHCFDYKVSIPKRIMQTWKTEILPDKWKATQISITKYMSNWEYTLMTDEMNRKFISTYFPDFLSYFDAFPYPIQRADAIRYAWLYVKGGLYLDCDFEFLGPIDELFTEDSDLFVLASSNTPNVITNGFIAAKPGNKLFLDMIEEMKKPAGIMALERHLHVMYTTGPKAFDRVIKRNKTKYYLLPSNRINPCTLCEKVCDKPGALLRPLEGSSWVGGAAGFYQWCYCQGSYLAVGAVITILIISLIIFMLWYH